MMKQLTLNIIEDLTHFDLEDFFISESNAAAHKIIMQWPQWSSAGLVLCGPPGSGKTCLARIWQARSHARFLNRALLESTEGLLAESIILEDIETLISTEAANGQAATHLSKLLLRCVNFLTQNNLFFILTARNPPSLWRIDLPDLSSRLKALPFVRLEEPDDMLLEIILQKGFFSRQLQVSPEVVSYLLKRIPRSFAAVRWWIDHIDNESLSCSRTITIPFLKPLLDAACV